MPYTKTIWVDETLGGDQTFKILKPTGVGVDQITDLAQCKIELYPTITQRGTELSAANLNKIEQAIYDLFVEVETVVADDTLLSFTVLSDTEAWTVGDGKFYWTVPPELDGAELINAQAYCMTPSTSGTPTVQIARGRRSTETSTPTWNNMLSTAITIDVNEYSSTDDLNQRVINTGYDDIATRDVIRFDIDGAGTGTKGLQVSMVFRK